MGTVVVVPLVYGNESHPKIEVTSKKYLKAHTGEVFTFVDQNKD